MADPVSYLLSFVRRRQGEKVRRLKKANPKRSFLILDVFLVTDLPTLRVFLAGNSQVAQTTLKFQIPDFGCLSRNRSANPEYFLGGSVAGSCSGSVLSHTHVVYTVCIGPKWPKSDREHIIGCIISHKV